MDTESEVYQPPRSWQQAQPRDDEPLPPPIESWTMPVGGAVMLAWSVWYADRVWHFEPYPQPVLVYVLHWGLCLLAAFTAVGLMLRRPWSLGLAVPLMGVPFVFGTLLTAWCLVNQLADEPAVSWSYWPLATAVVTGVFAIPWYRLAQRQKVRALLESERRQQG